MNKSTKILTLFLILIFNAKISFSYSNYDECSILWDKIVDNFAKYSLDEPYITSENRYGISINYNDDGTKSIIEMHQDLDDEIQNNYSAYLLSTKILEINEKEVSSLTDEEFDAEFEGNQIKIKVDRYDDLFILNKKDYQSIIIDDVIVDLHDISNINTKTSQFDANFTIHSAWRDNRYIKIANAVFLNKPGDEETGFFCRFDIEDIDDLKIFYPKLIPQRFITKRDDIIRTFEFHYEPPSGTYCETESNFNDCSPSELKNGLARFEFKENYLGTINDRFPVHDFPFDYQYLRFNIHPDRSHNFFFNTQLNTKSISSSYLNNAVENLYSPEWEFSDWYIEDDNFYDPATFQLYQTLNFDFEIKRKSLYYIFKLVIPVIFLIVLSGMVFFIRIDDLQSRLTISVVCFLSLIAYIFVVDDELPKLGYLTFIDIFILISYMFSGLPTLQTVLIEQIKIKKNTNISLKIDRFFKRFYFLGYIVSLVILTIYFDL